MKKKTILAAINARYSHPNLALRYLRAYTADLDCDVEIREFTINDSDDAIIAGIVDGAPDVIALSVYIWNSTLVARLIPRIRMVLPRALLVAGGPEAGCAPDRWLGAHQQIDHVVTGHGEEGFRRLLSRGCSSGERIIASANPPFDRIPFPYRDDDFERDNLRARNVYYEGSRGCPFRCSYCLSSRGDQRLEFRSMDLVTDEIAFLVRRRPGLIKFVDRTFNADRDRAIALWDHLAARYGSAGTRFHFEIHPALLDDESVRVLRGMPTGLFQFEMGVQSVHDATNVIIGRAGTWDLVRENIVKLGEAGNIRMHVDMIAGLPGEDRDMVRDSFDGIYALGAEHFQLGFLKALPGTRMADEAPAHGITFGDTAPYEIIESARLTRADLAELRSIDRLINNLHNTGRFAMTMGGVIESFESPFAAYRAIAAYARDAATPLPDKGWEANAALILDFSYARMPERRDYLFDCLSWDWCATSRTHVRPNLLKRPESARARRSFLDATAGRRIETEMTDDGTPPTAGELRGGLFFYAHTDEFRARHALKFEAAVFLRGEAGARRIVYVSSIS